MFYTKAVELYPQYYHAFHRRGEAYLKLKDIMNAKKDFETALSLKKDYQPAILAVARLAQANIAASHK